MVIVVIAHYNEDLQWLSKLKYPYTVISKNGCPKETPPNKGFEASSYLQYIINNYDNLCEYTIFLHGHQTSWHHQGNNSDIINSLVFNQDYQNINKYVYTLKKFPESLAKAKQLLPEIFKILDIQIDINSIVFRCSAQFYVKKENIHRYPKEKYQELYDWIMNTKEVNYWSSRMFEYIWHIIFTGKIIES